MLHEGGELDIRGAYCAVSVASLAQIIDPLLFEGTSDWIASCQTYEGGFGSSPNMEAHGGYTFCGSAALSLLGRTGNCDLQKLLRWTVNRQMKLEGGFQGRTNKLVDGCYSFWQGAAVPVIQGLLLQKEQNFESKDLTPKLDTPTNSGDKQSPDHSSTDDSSSITEAKVTKMEIDDPSTVKNYLQSEVMFDRGALQEYVLMACQLNKGGLVDKPGKPRDLYHTCYGLSGLSISQNGGEGPQYCIDGDGGRLSKQHILHNVPPEKVNKAYSYFHQKYNLNNTSDSSNKKLKVNESDSGDENYTDEDETSEFA